MLLRCLSLIGTVRLWVSLCQPSTRDICLMVSFRTFYCSFVCNFFRPGLAARNQVKIMAEELGLVMGPSLTKESTPVVMDARPENGNIAIAKPEPEKEKMSNINVQPVNVQHLNVQPVNVQAVKEEVAGSKVASGEGLGSQQVQVVKKLMENWNKIGITKTNSGGREKGFWKI